MKTKGVILIILSFMIVVIASFAIIRYSPALPEVKITGNGLSGTISITINSEGNFVLILSPSNVTYDYEAWHENNSYTLDLNVSSNFEAALWNYTLTDLRHNVVNISGQEFNPNTTINALRWGNQLDVSGRDFGGTWYNASVVFYVNVLENTAPILGYINSTFYVCEGNTFSWNYNASDADEDKLSVSLSPNNVFYSVKTSQTYGNIIAKLASRSILTKGNAGNHSLNISVSDGSLSDTKNTIVSVLEINNAPVFTRINNQSVWTIGLDSSFEKQAEVNDVEDLSYSSGNLEFNISFEGDALFGINGTGFMNFTPDNSSLGVHNVIVCVLDRGIDDPSPLLPEECNQDGGPISVCNSFSLTVTNSNRAPIIVSYSPSELSQNISGTEELGFSVTTKDDDGTIPDVYWYADDVLKETDAGVLGFNTSEFSYTFGCGVSGSHNVKVVVSDGLNQTSLQWNFSVSNVPCSVPSSPSSGGGGSLSLPGRCVEDWVCSDWNVCQNTKRSFDSNGLSPEDYDSLFYSCQQIGYDERYCGFQMRSCDDLTLCLNDNYKAPKPDEMQVCYFTENPSCTDGITNCHHGGCELLVDCGGPCPTCPSCSDGLQNQGEEDVDCGGPCPTECERAETINTAMLIRYGLLSMLLILIVFIIIEIIRIIRNLKQKKKKKE